MFDPLKRNGELYQKLMYQQRKIRKEGAQQCDLDENDENTGKTEEELLEYFENCILPDNKIELIAILKDSFSVRYLDLLGDRTLIEKSFHLYLVLPELVCSNL